MTPASGGPRQPVFGNRPLRQWSPIALCALAIVGPTTAARAQDPSPAPTQVHMTGDWGGVRPELDQAGITLRGSYVAEAAGNPCLLANLAMPHNKKMGAIAPSHSYHAHCDR